MGYEGKCMSFGIYNHTFYTYKAVDLQSHSLALYGLCSRPTNKKDVAKLSLSMAIDNTLIV